MRLIKNTGIYVKTDYEKKRKVQLKKPKLTTKKQKPQLKKQKLTTKKQKLQLKKPKADYEKTIATTEED